MSLDQLFAEWRSDPSNRSAEASFFTGLRTWALKDNHADEDLAQELSIAVLASADRIEGNLEHWLRATARNLRTVRFRHNQMIRRKGLTSLQLSDHDDAALDDVLSGIDWESLSPEEYRIACWITEGYSLQEMAEAEGITTSAIKTRLWRIRQRNKAQ